MGEFVKALLVERHIKFASVARAMEIKPESFSGYFESKVISDDILNKMAAHLKFDLVGMVQDEVARRSNTRAYKPASTQSARAQEPSVPYERATGSGGPSLTVRLLDYDEATQLQIVKFLQQQPLRSRSLTVKSGS